MVEKERPAREIAARVRLDVDVPPDLEEDRPEPGDWGPAGIEAFARYWSTWPADERRAWCRAWSEEGLEGLSASPEREALRNRIRRLAELPESGRSMVAIVAAHLAAVADFERLAAAEGMGVFVEMRRFNKTASEVIPGIRDFPVPNVKGGGLDDLLPFRPKGRP